MALKYLTTAEMTQITAGWLTKGAAHDLLVGTPLFAPFVKRLEAVQGKLLTAQKPADGASDAAYASLVAEAAALDAEHDSLIRSTYGYLETLSVLANDPTLLDLRTFVLPQGLGHTSLSYRGQAGAAAALEARLHDDPSKKKALKEIPVLKKSLWSTVEAWLAAAKRLGQIEDEKAALAVAPSTSMAPAETLRARNEWVRIVGALRSVADMDELAEDARGVLFAALDAAERSADRRAKKTAAPAASETPA